MKKVGGKLLMLNIDLRDEIRARDKSSSSLDKNLRFTKNRIFSAVLLIIFILFINISFISASQKYTLKVTEEHLFYVVDNNINDEETNIINVYNDLDERVGKSEIKDKNNIKGIWKTASKLKIGDSLLTADGKKVKITSVKSVEDDVEVYNLEAEPFNDYVVDGDVVVHNSNAVQIANTQIPTRAEIDSIKTSPRKAVLDSYVEDYIKKRNPNAVDVIMFLTSDAERIFVAEELAGRQLTEMEMKYILYVRYQVIEISEKEKILGEIFDVVLKNLFLYSGVSGEKIKSSKALNFFGPAEKKVLPNLEQSPKRVLIVSDIHGRMETIQALQSIISEEGISELWFLGDYDTPEVFNYAFSSSYRFQGVEVKLLLGNHELGMVYPEYGFESPNSADYAGSRDSSKLTENFRKDSEAYAELKELANQAHYGLRLDYANPANPQKNIRIGLGHSGPSTLYRCKGEGKIAAENVEGVWNRIKNERDARGFFIAMCNYIDILFRGHDHKNQGLWVREGGKIEKYAPTTYDFKFGDKKQMIVTVGALSEGNYVILDINSESIKIQFMSLFK